ncbi:MAG: SMI1/KNR4 family protein [Ruminococcaceae bacterium]|nr:SMI1/KNR4 family protein [Oscillospiraceae bacterium]
MGRYANAIARCEDNNLKIILKKLDSYSDYSLFCPATGVEYNNFRNLFDSIPNQVRAWYKLFNGGYLFDTMFLSTKYFEDHYRVRLGSFRIYNSSMARKFAELPDDKAVFSVASFGDFYCFNTDGSPTITQFSVTEHQCVAQWSNFSVWLNQEVNAALDLVDEEILQPFSIYYQKESL